MATTAGLDIETATYTIRGRFNPLREIEPAFSYQVEAGRTISEIVRAAPDVPSWFWLTGEVRINGKRLSRDVWDITRPKLSRPDRPIIITLHPVFHGGAGGGSTKNIVTTVAAIALIAGATLVSGGLLGPPTATGIGTGLFGAAFAATGWAAGLPVSNCGIAGKLATTLDPPLEVE